MTFRILYNFFNLVAVGLIIFFVTIMPSTSEGTDALGYEWSFVFLTFPFVALIVEAIIWFKNRHKQIKKFAPKLWPRYIFISTMVTNILVYSLFSESGARKYVEYYNIFIVDAFFSQIDDNYDNKKSTTFYKEHIAEDKQHADIKPEITKLEKPSSKEVFWISLIPPIMIYIILAIILKYSFLGFTCSSVLVYFQYLTTGKFEILIFYEKIAELLSAEYSMSFSIVLALFNISMIFIRFFHSFEYVDT